MTFLINDKIESDDPMIQPYHFKKHRLETELKLHAYFISLSFLAKVIMR